MHTKQCLQCSKTFQIDERDTVYYGRIGVPEPTRCPDCRQQRRAAWRNERKLYSGQCQLCRQPMVSLYAPDSPYTVYCQDCWWGDGWDGLRYGRDYDFSKPFFEHYRTLQLQVPRIALFNLHSTNSAYTNHSANNKNCYMGVAMGQCEDCLYGMWVTNSRNCLDCLYVENCELCYECSYCEQCYQTLFSQHCQTAKDSMFCFECRDIDHCLGCVQLQHKEYYILNKPVTQAEFERTKQQLLSDPTQFTIFQASWEELKLKAPRRHSLQVQCEQSTGNDLYHCKNVLASYNCRDSEDCKYMFDLGCNKDSMDCYEHGWLVPSQLCYEAHAGMGGYNFRFTNICADSRDLTYCDLCFQGSANLFGCIGLKKQSFCILNKQYAEADYHQVVEKIAASKEYGEFFPIAFSPFAYNESVAQEYFPLTQDQAERLGWRWQIADQREYQSQTIVVPSEITAVPDAVTQALLACQLCRKNYKILPQELAFYRQVGVPVPVVCPDCRHLRRMQLRNPRELWQRQCMCTQTDHGHKGRCAREFETTYSPERKEIIYCHICYQKEIY